MREILFRGKRLDNGEWVFGDLYHRGKEVVITSFYAGHHVAVDPATVGQFTGLLANGKRIFEGDVCRFKEWISGEMCWVGKVHFEYQQFVISGGPNKECPTSFYLAMSRFAPEDIEVIGNIHDPELLEVTPDE